MFDQEAFKAMRQTSNQTTFVVTGLDTIVLHSTTICILAMSTINSLPCHNVNTHRRRINPLLIDFKQFKNKVVVVVVVVFLVRHFIAAYDLFVHFSLLCFSLGT